MQLNVTTDYAIRMILDIALKDKIVTAAEISNDMKIPKSYVLKMAKRLKTAGLLYTERGSSGGYGLKREPWDISIQEVIEVMEGTTKINRCLEPDHYCSRRAVETCPGRKNYEKLQFVLDDTLSGITIDRLMV